MTGRGGSPRVGKGNRGRRTAAGVGWWAQGPTRAGLSKQGCCRQYRPWNLPQASERTGEAPV
ncbi:MAG: hypothetical protein AVDCRST_MAG33-570 [uncultured Thermomicrobiales bacterium]|uniref:Uncharacterized protein n=1 Tax=uncultured Thermomicrobiales bacterium TaxID=1645740 RepID=A0A6J4UDP4_9BACT|nr:MAG: hypothetical protein AVDCRST_MAG33-570 [uncultured Thermomicrobiales bacterium]